jgi:hypothetical protein
MKMDINEMQNSNTEYAENEEVKFNGQLLEPDDSSNIEPEGPSGIGGWLILIAIGRILSPLIILATILNTYLPVILSDKLNMLSRPGSINYSELWKPTIFFEFGYNIIVLILGVVLLFLFFGRKRIFPKAYIGLVIFSIIFSTIDVILMAKIQSSISINVNTNATNQIIRQIVTAAIWIPYFLKSVRVKNTFVR